MRNAERLDKSILDDAIVAYYEDLKRAVRRSGAPQVHPSDVVHDLYVQLSRNPDRLVERSSLRGFLIKAAVNLGIDRARRIAFENRLFSLLDDRALSVPAPSAARHEGDDGEKRIRAIKAAIAALPPQCRTVFIAYRVAGMSKVEIADSLGIQRRMVDRHIRNALLSCLDKVSILD